MKFNCVFINKRTNAKISKDFTVNALTYRESKEARLQLCY